MILFGENFPQWFQPYTQILPPKKPIEPTKIITQLNQILVEDIFIDGLSPIDVIYKLSIYDNDHKIEQSSYDRISVYKLQQQQIELTDKEFNKKHKEYERKISRYEKDLVEYQIRKEKYVILLEKYEKLKLEDELKILEDNLQRNEVDFSRLEFEIQQDKQKIQEIKKQLKKELK